MYISRWIVRGVVLAAAVILVPTIMRPIINPQTLTAADKGFDPLPNAVMLLVAFVLIVLAWGQFQYAYQLFQLNRLLHEVAGGRMDFLFTIDQNTVVSVKRRNGQFRLEIVDRSSLDLVIFIVSGKKIEAKRLTGALTVVSAHEPADFHQIMFDEEPFSPDYRKEMRRLQWGLARTLPLKGRFTP